MRVSRADRILQRIQEAFAAAVLLVIELANRFHQQRRKAINKFCPGGSGVGEFNPGSSFFVAAVDMELDGFCSGIAPITLTEPVRVTGIASLHINHRGRLTLSI